MLIAFDWGQTHGSAPRTNAITNCIERRGQTSPLSGEDKTGLDLRRVRIRQQGDDLNLIAFRTAQPDDAIGMLDLLDPRTVPDPAAREALPELWQRWMQSGEMEARVIEYRRHDGSPSIEAFGAVVFLGEAFVSRYRRKPAPFLANCIYQLASTGRSPLMSHKRVAEANWTCGLSLFILHYCQRAPGKSEAAFEQVLTVAHAAFRDTTEGYDLNELWQEAFSPEEVSFLRAGGMKPILDRTHGAGVHDSDGELPPLPCLMGLTREDAAKGFPGTTVSFAFQTRSPLFFFTPVQQRVIRFALHGDSDADIAQRLRVSQDAVKQTWRSIYQRVSLDDGRLLIDQSSGGGTLTNHRRRNILLDYLRTHPEELRPVKRPRGSATGR